jgi:hypothetical protein
MRCTMSFLILHKFHYCMYVCTYLYHCLYVRKSNNAVCEWYHTYTYVRTYVLFVWLETVVMWSKCHVFCNDKLSVIGF